MVDKATIDEWRKEQGTGMVSLVGEYTPQEFWDLLDDYEQLLNKAMAVVHYVDKKAEPSHIDANHLQLVRDLNDELKRQRDIGEDL